MALTEEMQEQIDFQKAVEEARIAANAMVHSQHQKLEAVRIAQNVIFENRRVKLASEVADVTASDITSLADSLLTFINS